MPKAKIAVLTECSSANSLRVHVNLEKIDVTTHVVLFWRDRPITGQEVTTADSFYEFHYLPEDNPFEVKLVAAATVVIDEVQARTSAMDPVILSHSEGMATELYVGEQHLPFGSWIMEHRGNWLWGVAPFCWTPRFVNELFRCGLFPLPDGDNMLPIINPEERYCIDLRESIEWDKSKRVRRHRRDFKLSVNRDFEGSLGALQEYHATSGSTWLNERLLQVLVGLKGKAWSECGNGSDKENAEDVVADLCVFELWEHGGTDSSSSSSSSSRSSRSSSSITTKEHKPTDRLVAVVAGFGIGRVWHDYSMCTLLKDRRSLGALLTKTVGHLLKESGYDIWYWGCKIGYMESYDEYGGKLFDRMAFWERWSTAREQQPSENVRDMIRQGRALVLPLIN